VILSPPRTGNSTSKLSSSKSEKVFHIVKMLSTIPTRLGNVNRKLKTPFSTSQDEKKQLSPPKFRENFREKKTAQIIDPILGRFYFIFLNKHYLRKNIKMAQYHCKLYL